MLNFGVSLKYFTDMGLKPELLDALRRMNFVAPTEVQEQVIPIALTGKDIIVRAKTGTGKTAAFLIPIVQKIVSGSDPCALIVVPTRELALQIADVASKLINKRESVTVVYGAASINVQMDNLDRHPEIVVGTPGRILDLVERGALRLEHIKFLVLDEGDTMLDMGFIDDIERIISKTPSTRQTMLFSATMPERIIEVAKKNMKEFEYMKIGNEEQLVAVGVKHYYTECEKFMKFATLLAYLDKYNPTKAIVFAHTKYAADEIHEALNRQGIESVIIHGNITQAKREGAIKAFKRGARLLIATNIAARGLDIQGVSDIINFDLPDDPVIYLHRVGRSARMNANGRAFSLITANQHDMIRDIEDINNIKIEKIDIDATKFKYAKIFSRDRRTNARGFGSERNGRRGEQGGHGEHGEHRGFRNRPHRGYDPDRHNSYRRYSGRR